jgi:hypothetical protein
LPIVSVSFVRERTMSMLTVRECSSIEILRTQLKGDVALVLAPGTHVIFPADAEEPAARDSKRSGNASRFACVLMVAYVFCTNCYRNNKH